MAVNTPYKKSTATTTNHTANYDLPLWAGEDTTSWLTQMNDAMNKIDDGMVDAKSKALEVVGIAADAKKLADETKAESAASAKIVAGYNDRLTAAEEKIVEHTQDITNLNTRSDQFDVELHSVQEVQKKTTADLATLAAKVDTNKSDADAKISANTEAIAKTDANLATLSGKVTALETEVGEVSSVTQTNTNAISAINTTIDGIKAKDTAQDGQISTINTEVSSLDSRVTALEDGGGGSSKFEQFKTKRIMLTNLTIAAFDYTNTDKQPATDVHMDAHIDFYQDGTFFITLGSVTESSFSLLGSTYVGLHFNDDSLDLAEVLTWMGLPTTGIWGKQDVMMSPAIDYTTYTGSTKSAIYFALNDFQISNKFVDIKLKSSLPFSGNGTNDFAGPIRLFGRLHAQ